MAKDGLKNSKYLKLNHAEKKKFRKFKVYLLHS